MLWLYGRDMFCVPLYTFSGTGLRNKPDFLKREYVSVSNSADVEFVNQGNYQPIQVDARRPLDQNTTVHLSGGIKVGCEEDISRVGRVTRESFQHLLNLWTDLSEAAKQESMKW